MFGHIFLIQFFKENLNLNMVISKLPFSGEIGSFFYIFFFIHEKAVQTLPSQVKKLFKRYEVIVLLVFL